MWLKIFSCFVLLASASTIFAQEATIACNYVRRGPAYPYTCQLSINNPNGNDGFASIPGEHLDGLTNDDVTSVEAFLQNSAIIPRVICSQFPNLEHLSFMMSEVTTVNEQAFAECASLNSVTLIYNNLTTIPANTFRNNANLQYIYASNNFINFLHPTSFAGSSAVLINLEFNEMTTFHSAAFSGVNETLAFLGIFANLITTLPSGAFANLRNLEWLDITANEFQSIEDDAFVGLDRLTTLYAIACNLREPRTYWFTSMPALEELHLELNEISDLTGGVFAGTRRLTRLFLGYNELTEITTAPFGGSLINIEVLSLVNNRVFAMHAFFFASAQNLDSLELLGNACNNANHLNIQNNRGLIQGNLRRCFDNFGSPFMRCAFSPVAGDYTCQLFVRNALGQDFTAIEGEHVADREDEDVLIVNAFEANTRIIPPVLCRNFVSLQRVSIVASYLEELAEDAFGECSQLQRLDLSYNWLWTLPTGAFRRNSHLTEVNLRRNAIMRIEVGAFDGSAIESLDLSFNELLEFDANAFAGINETLTSLDLSVNRIAVLNSDHFANLRNLEELLMNENFLYIVPADAFASLTNLHTLGLSNCGLRELDPVWFVALTNLRTLTIASNGLSEFPTGVFDSLINLNEIFFYANEIVELRADSFGGSLASLHLLYGTSNWINLVDGEILERGTNLQTLLFYDNLCTMRNVYEMGLAREELERCIGNFEAEVRHECRYEVNEVDGSYWCDLTAINPAGREVEGDVTGEHVGGNGDANVTFILADNSNTLTIPSGLCQQFTSLTRLEFFSSFVSLLTFSSFTGCSSLTSFIAVANNITTVPAMVFNGAPNLEEIILSFNRIRSLSASAFYGTRATLIDLSENELGVFDTMPFAVVGATLRILRLSHNRLAHLPIGAFAGTPNLVELNLNHNHLYTIPSNTFMPLASLEILEMLDCGIRRIDEEWFAGLDNLIYLQLSHNEIDHLSENIFDLPSLDSLSISSNNLATLDATSFGRSLTSLFHIDASHNSITTIDPQFFDNSTSLFGLELMENSCIDNVFLELPTYRQFIRDYFNDCFEAFEMAAPSCEFTEDEAQYQCHMTINNPNQRLRFETIDTNHMEGRNDNYVSHVLAEGGNTRSIPTILCQQFRYLESIVFVESQVEMISRETFRKCEFLFSLNLAANMIETIPDGAFRHNVYLTSLILALNRIETITPRMFEGTQIYYLDLENNRLANFDPITLAPIANNLFYLFLQNNRYTTFPRNAFTSFRRLRYLLLHGNQLEFLPSNAFRSLTSLNTLDLVNCGLSTINYRWFDDLEGLSVLGVDANGIEHLPPRAFDLPNLRYLGIAGNRLMELNSDAFGRSLTSLVSLHAEVNLLNAIDPVIIDEASQLFTLSLNGNLCVDLDFIEVQENIDAVRERLSGCFDNFPMK